MRFTPQLYGEFRKGFWFKNIWKKKSQYKVTQAPLAQALQEAGIEPVDPVKEFFSKKKPNVWIPPNDPRFMFPPLDCDHPDYHPTSAYTVSEKVRLWEGVKQAQILTNSLINNALPDCILSKADEMRSDEQDHYMQRAILQAHLWDTAREKLPRRKKPDDISVMNYKAEFGIPQTRLVNILLQQITQRCSLLLSQQSGIKNALSKRMLEQHSMNTYTEFDGQNIYVTCDSPLLLTSNTPVPSYADPEQVKESKHGTIPDMFPVSPTVDLDRSYVYKEICSLGHSEQYKFRRHHTLFLEYPKEWTMEMRHANALLMSYAHSCAIAREYKLTQQLISDPVCVQTVHTDGEMFGYTCFQLNTLQSSTEAAKMSYATRKNMAWIDHDLLFEKAIPRRGMLRDTKYRGYNSQVFKKILGLYVH